MTPSPEQEHTDEFSAAVNRLARRHAKLFVDELETALRGRGADYERSQNSRDLWIGPWRVWVRSVIVRGSDGQFHGWPSATLADRRHDQLVELSNPPHMVGGCTVQAIIDCVCGPLVKH